MEGADAGYAGALGAVRGAAAGLAYALVLLVVVLVDDLSDASASTGDLLGGAVTVAVVVASVAVPVGMLGGLLLGLLLMPVAVRLRPLTAGLACAALVAVPGVLAFPMVPLGSRPDDLGGLVVFSVVPALLAGAAAGVHGARMAQRSLFPPAER